MNEMTDISKWMSINEYIAAVSALVRNFFGEPKLFRVLVFWGEWEAGPAKAIASSIMTPLLSPEFRTAVKEGVEYEWVEKDPDQVITIMKRSKTG